MSASAEVLPTLSGPVIADKICTKCKRIKKLIEFHKHPTSPGGRHPRCKKCRSEDANSAPKRSRIRTAEVQRRNHLKYKYGITPEQYVLMLSAQGGLCAICGTDNPGGRWGIFHVDHCHETGKVRGLLCMNCNNGIGKFGDEPKLLRSAAKYLEEH